jgi:hypothetical protein
MFLKKFGSMLLLFTFISSVLTMPVGYAASTSTLKVDNATVVAGSVVELPIRLTSSGDVAALQLQLSYDTERFILTEVKNGSELPLNFSVMSNLTTKQILIGSIGSTLSAGTREIAKAVFQIKEGVANGHYPVGLSMAKLADSSSNELTSQFRMENGEIVVVTTLPPSNGGENEDEPSPQPPNDTKEASPSPKADEAVIVIVNGKEENAGKARTTKVNNQTVTAVEVDDAKILAKLEEQGNGATIVIPVNTGSDVVIGELNGQMVKSMEQKQAVVQVQTGGADYTLPANLLNIDAISKQIGGNVVLRDIKIKVEIGTPTEDVLQRAEAAARTNGFVQLTQPVNFAVKSIYGEREVEVSTFNAYVQRSIQIPGGVDPAQITTGVVVEPDGTVRHVPTRVIQREGKYYAEIKSLTNSTYSVIWHPTKFEDMEQHWAKDVVNDMGSRMVISGFSDDTYKPEQDITRAEFAAIMVRGLGLKLGSGTTPFTDIQAADWYSGAIRTANEYGLINGYEDGTFRPNEKITREQAMLIVSKAMDITALEGLKPDQQANDVLQAYGDVEEVSAWAKSGAAESVQAGIISGRNSNQLAPNAFITRAEVAVMVQRLLKKSNLI